MTGSACLFFLDSPRSRAVTRSLKFCARARPEAITLCPLVMFCNLVIGMERMGERSTMTGLAATVNARVTKVSREVVENILQTVRQVKEKSIEEV